MMLIIHTLVKFFKKFPAFHPNCKKFPLRNADGLGRPNLDGMMKKNDLPVPLSRILIENTPNMKSYYRCEIQQQPVN